MTTDYRALSAELFAAVQLYTGQNPAAADMPSNKIVGRLMAAMAATATALSQPEPVGPTDKEIDDWWDERCELTRLGKANDFWSFDVQRSDLHKIVRAALARWGRPTLQPDLAGPTDEELTLFTVEWWRSFMHLEGGAKEETPINEIIHSLHFVDFLEDALARWGRPAITPIPVSERLPGPEDCDAEGFCWWWHPDHKEEDFSDGWMRLKPEWAVGRHDSDDSAVHTHWLPAHALPLPAAAALDGPDGEWRLKRAP